MFKRRALNTGSRRPTQAELATELGVTGSRTGQMEAAMRRRLDQRMREPSWPIRLATEQLREELGAVARLQELEKAFDRLGSDISLESTGSPHRRQLLLRLCDYRIDDEWVLGPDIERLTDVILEAVASGEESDLDNACRHLARLGVREEVQLHWIVSRVGFRIIEGQVVASDARIG